MLQCYSVSKMLLFSSKKRVHFFKAQDTVYCLLRYVRKTLFFKEHTYTYGCTDSRASVIQTACENEEWWWWCIKKRCWDQILAYCLFQVSGIKIPNIQKKNYDKEALVTMSPYPKNYVRFCSIFISKKCFRAVTHSQLLRQLDVVSRWPLVQDSAPSSPSHDHRQELPRHPSSGCETQDPAPPPLRQLGFFLQITPKARCIVDAKT